MTVWFVMGENAIDKINKIKRKVRKKYAQNPFSNCVHTPSTLSELLMQKCIIENRYALQPSGDACSGLDPIARSIWKKSMFRLEPNLGNR